MPAPASDRPYRPRGGASLERFRARLELLRKDPAIGRTRARPVGQRSSRCPMSGHHGLRRRPAAPGSWSRRRQEPRRSTRGSPPPRSLRARSLPAPPPPSPAYSAARQGLAPQGRRRSRPDGPLEPGRGRRGRRTRASSSAWRWRARRGCARRGRTANREGTLTWGYRPAAGRRGRRRMGTRPGRRPRMGSCRACPPLRVRRRRVRTRNKSASDVRARVRDPAVSEP